MTPLICKICNPSLEGNGYCAEHSTSGTAYNFMLKKETKEKIIEIISKDPFWGKDSKIPNQEMIWDAQADQILELFSQEEAEIIELARRAESQTLLAYIGQFGWEKTKQDFEKEINDIFDDRRLTNRQAIVNSIVSFMKLKFSQEKQKWVDDLILCPKKKK